MITRFGEQYKGSGENQKLEVVGKEGYMRNVSDLLEELNCRYQCTFSLFVSLLSVFFEEGADISTRQRKLIVEVAGDIWVPADEQGLRHYFVVQPAETSLLTHIRDNSRSRKPAIWSSMDGVRDLRGIGPLTTGVYPVENFAQSALVSLLQSYGGNDQSIESTRDVLDKFGTDRRAGILPQSLERSPEVEEIGKWNH